MSRLSYGKPVMIRKKDKDHSETSFSLIEADKQFRSMKETWR